MWVNQANLHLILSLLPACVHPFCGNHTGETFPKLHKDTQNICESARLWLLPYLSGVHQVVRQQRPLAGVERRALVDLRPVE